MKRLNYSIVINAPKEKVWEAMLEDKGYRYWTSVFNKGGSYYEGDWSKGSKMRFLGPDPQTKEIGGVYAIVIENIPFKIVSLEHQGEIKNNLEQPESSWKGARETYIFSEVANGTEVKIELDSTDEFGEYMNAMWPPALEKLKEFAEKL